ncbi:sulfatase [Escherichia coli]|nr:sulfatase [Escherichia coli]
MIKSNLAIAIGFTLLTTFGASAQTVTRQPKLSQVKPNIILFLVDDMGFTDTSVQFGPERVPANDFFQTPAMENLAKNGVKFTQAYAHSVCSPSRISLMTGQNPVRHHSTNWLMLPNSDAQNGDWGPTGSPVNWDTIGIEQNDVTLPKLLKKAGYYTIHVGKAHFASLGSSGADPKNIGFDVNIAGHAAGAPASYLGEKNFGNDMPVKDGYPQGVPGLEKYWGKNVHLTDVLTERAEQEIDKALEGNKPFFLNMSYYAVHTPIEPHPRFIKNYRGKTYKGTDIAIPETEARYASMVEGMDASVGDIMKHLEEKGIAENTLIVFTSDNGGLSGHSRQTTPRGTELNTHNYPLKAGKGSAYDGGSRVPYIVSWAVPDKKNAFQKALPLKSGAVSATKLIIEDIFPTFLDVANKFGGVSTSVIPADYKIDGIDTVKLWENPSENIIRPLVMHYPHIWGPVGPGYEPYSSLRYGDYKVIYFYNSKTWEMYNTTKDTGENYNLAPTEPRKLQELAGMLKNKLISMDVQWPVNRLTGMEEKLQTPEKL